MKTTISSKSDSIQSAYDNYVKGQYIVNRNYQRKLVWTLEEKMAFIDSIYNHYSVPLFLVADTSDNQSKRYEIIDGMQRLNAIFSFIENEFPIVVDDKKGYFNLDTLSITMIKRDKHEIEQKEPVLDREICSDIVSYQLPFSYVTADKTDVEEIFRRINSYGRQLSNQEIRQAGALGEFPTLVRKLSSQIRGDVSTSDSIELGNMKHISLSNVRLPYGIVMDDTFWVKQNIITKNRMRVSRDEELIAWILAYIILGDKVRPTAKSLDRLYMYQDEEGKKLAQDVECALQMHGVNNVSAWFMDVFSTIKTITEASGKDFRSLIFSKDDGEGLVRSFQIIYLAFYELMIIQKMRISEMHKLISKLDGIGVNHLRGISGDNWSAKLRKEKIDAIIGIIRGCFSVYKGADVAYENWALQLDNILHLSITEGNQYDYKTGFHTLYPGKDSFNAKMVHKCIEVLTAEVNKHAYTKGYVLIGISEKAETMENFKRFYRKPETYVPVSNTNFYVTGIEDEIKKYYNGEGDKYIRAIKAEIEKCPIDDYTKTTIQQNMKFVSYYGHTVLSIELESGDSPIYFDNKIFIRKGSDTESLENAKAIVEYVSHFCD